MERRLARPNAGLREQPSQRRVRDVEIALAEDVEGRLAGSAGGGREVDRLSLQVPAMKATKVMRKMKTAQERADFAKHWRVENGELVNAGTGPYANTTEELGDIELLIEYRTVAKADSGIYLRGTPQVQIWDKNQVYDPKKADRKPHLGSGGLFNNTPGSPGRDPLVVADKAGNVLGLYRMSDATVFSIDVAVAKARNTAYYADATALQNADKVDDDLLVSRGAKPAQVSQALADNFDRRILTLLVFARSCCSSRARTWPIDLRRSSLCTSHR